MSLIKMTDIELKDKKVLIREDLNVPIKNGVVASDARINAALYTIETALKAGAKVYLMSHLGRPKPGQFDKAFSLKPVAQRLDQLLSYPVKFIADWENIPELQSGEVALLENVRFLDGEQQNDEALSQKMANLCDIFVMDAFGTAHRKHSSTYGVAEFAKIAAAGPLLTAELEALSNALEEPNRPLVSIVGGSKVSTKLGVLQSILNISDIIIPGGGIANTLLAAAGFNVANSLYEPELLDCAKDLLQKAKSLKKEIFLPVDVVCAKAFDENAASEIKEVANLSEGDMILDIGPKSQQMVSELISTASTIIWNGPLGVFEFPAFSEGTRTLAQAIAKSKAFSIAGGGDTLAAIDEFIDPDAVSYISTGGGAFLQFVEKHKLPAVSILQQRSLFK